MDAPPELVLRAPGPELIALPWNEPLERWDEMRVPLRDMEVGPSRHLVRFVEADGALWALKDMPERIARREYDVLRRLETECCVRSGAVRRAREERIATLLSLVHEFPDRWDAAKAGALFADAAAVSEDTVAEEVVSR